MSFFMKWIVIILFSELCKIDVPYAIRTWRELWILQAFRTSAGKDHEKEKRFQQQFRLISVSHIQFRLNTLDS